MGIRCNTGPHPPGGLVSVVARLVCAAAADPAQSHRKQFFIIFLYGSDPAHTRRADSIQLWRVWSAQLLRIGATTAGRNVTARNAIHRCHLRHFQTDHRHVYYHVYQSRPIGPPKLPISIRKRDRYVVVYVICFRPRSLFVTPSFLWSLLPQACPNWLYIHLSETFS